MFENSLYEPYQTASVATPTEEGDLFHNYEIKTWDLGTRIYKILAVSAVVNLVGLMVFAQGSLLTMKGCDSPLVGGVCQVLDTVYIGALLFGTDREYVDAAYDPTDLGDAEITFVDVSGVAPPLDYPEGYFQVANPVEYQAMLDGGNNTLPEGYIAPGIPITQPSTGGSLFDTTPNIPKRNPTIIDGNLPSFGDSGVVSNPTTRKGRTRKPPGTPNDTVAKTDDETPVTEPLPTPMSSEAVQAVEINKKPLNDFVDGITPKWAAKELDLSQDFVVVLNGVITSEGRLDRDKSKFDVTKQKGDPKMIDVGKAALEALGDTGYLTYLRSAGVDKVTVTLSQDKDQISVVITSAQKTAERAQTVASGVSGAILIGKTVVKNPSDERTLLDGAKTTTDGKNFVLNFVLPKPIAHEIINRKLTESQAKKLQPPLPNGTLMPRSANDKADK